jgi:hypothetical protein
MRDKSNTSDHLPGFGLLESFSGSALIKGLRASIEDTGVDREDIVVKPYETPAQDGARCKALTACPRFRTKPIPQTSCAVMAGGAIAVIVLRPSQEGCVAMDGVPVFDTKLLSEAKEYKIRPGSHFFQPVS